MLLFYLVLLHHYGQEGRELKKVSTNGVIIDTEILTQMTSTNFIEQFKNHTAKFIDYLNISNTKNLKDTTVTDLKSYSFATINTLDPNISIALTLEVRFKKKKFCI